MNVKKMAAEDAYEFGLAQMFFGEGAGNRRKLIEAKINHNVMNVPGYEQAIDVAFGKLNQIDMAERAIAERKRIDRAAKAGKNLRAIKSGNLRGLSTGVYVVVGGAYLAHVTGYDKKIQAEAKKAWGKVKTEYRIRKARRTVTNIFNYNNPGPEKESGV